MYDKISSITVWSVDNKNSHLESCYAPIRMTVPFSGFWNRVKAARQTWKRKAKEL